MRYCSFDIVFQEVPGEVTLALNITNCPFHCHGCHSPHLWEDTGEILDETELIRLIDLYRGEVTCVCFMGGDADPETVAALARVARAEGVKTAWYSGRTELPSCMTVELWDYLKLGPYREELGGLRSRTTNQRFYCIRDGQLLDETARFYR